MTGRVPTAAMLAGSLVLLCACSAGTSPGGAQTTISSGPAPAASPADRRGDEGDIAFASAMIPHLESELELAELALDSRYRASPRVIALAREEIALDKARISTMSTWLTQWGVADVADVTEAAGLPGTDPASIGGAQPPGETAIGPDQETVIGPDQMEQLGAYSGKNFDRRWLEMMIDHHAQAEAAARDVLATSSHADVIELANGFARDRNEQIVAMRALLRALSAPATAAAS